MQLFSHSVLGNLCCVRKCLLFELFCKNKAKEQGYMASPYNSNCVHQLIGVHLNKEPGLREAVNEEGGSTSPPHITLGDATQTEARTLNGEAWPQLEAVAGKITYALLFPRDPGDVGVSNCLINCYYTSTRKSKPVKRRGKGWGDK